MEKKETTASEVSQMEEMEGGGERGEGRPLSTYLTARTDGPSWKVVVQFVASAAR